jgi:Ethanolamine utilization protein EutJ (predicted chaperonin)
MAKTLRHFSARRVPLRALPRLRVPVQIFGTVATFSLWVGLALPGAQFLPGTNTAGNAALAVSLQSALLGVDAGKPTLAATQASASRLGLPLPDGRAPTTSPGSVARLRTELRGGAGTNSQAADAHGKRRHAPDQGPPVPVVGGTSSPQAQTISFSSSAPAHARYGDPAYQVSATASSGLPVSLSIDSGSSSVCSLAGNSVSYTGSGTCTIDGNQGGNAQYDPASQAQQSFTVAKAPQTIGFTSSAPANAHYGDPTYQLTATASSGLLVALSIDPSSSSVCTFDDNAVSYTSSGTCTIDADQAGNTRYKAGPRAQQSLSVGKAAQTIHFSSIAPANAHYGDTPYEVAATATSGLPVSFSIDPGSSSVCTIDDNSVSYTSSGTCTIDADQAGNSEYKSGPRARQSFSVGKAAQTITFSSSAPGNAQFGDPAYQAAVAASSGLPVSLSIDPGSSSVCSLAGTSIIYYTGSGTCTIDADQAGNNHYKPAPRARQSFTVAKAAQTIAFTSSAPAGAHYGEPAYQVSATASSGLSISLSIDPGSSSVCSLDGNTVSYAGSGTCTIDADQAGNSNYTSAPPAHQTFNVDKAAQTITFTSSAPTNAHAGDPPYEVMATAGSGLPVSLSIDPGSSSVCALDGNTVSYTANGICTIDADRPGNAQYAPAPRAHQSFGVGMTAQTISFGSGTPANAHFGDPAYRVTASASSGLPVSLSIDPGSSSVCTLNGNSVSYTGSGTCTVDADQPGDTSYTPAPQAHQSFGVAKALQTITFSSGAPASARYGDPAYHVAATASSGLPVSLSIDSGSSSVCSLSGSSVIYTGSGTCTINADRAGDSRYSSATRTQQSFTVDPATPIITWPAPAPIVWGTPLGPIQLDATASVPGTFRYTPGPGTVSGPGTQTLSATFTPNDTTRYAAVSATVQISVTFTQPCLTGPHPGQMIGAGQAICVASGGTITGPVDIKKGGALWVDGGTINGPVHAMRAASLDLCGAKVTGPFKSDRATGLVQVGGSGCAGNLFNGPVSITNGTGGVSFVGNTLAAPHPGHGPRLTITGNSGGFTYSGNTVSGPIRVTGNS